MTSLVGAEKWVAECIERALPGVTVSLHDDGTRNSMYDLNLARDGAVFGACEVTAAADQQCIEFWNVLNKNNGRWQEPTIQGGWGLEVEPSAKVRDLKRRLPTLLRTLESSPDDIDAHQDLKALGVKFAHRGGTDFPGSIYVVPWQDPSRMGGAVPENANGVVRWLSSWISAPEQLHNVEKVRQSGAAEGHLAVLLPAFAAAPFGAIDALMRDGVAEPDVVPQLPSGITHVWVMSTWNSGAIFHWDSRAWKSFSKYS